MNILKKISACLLFVGALAGVVAMFCSILICRPIIQLPFLKIDYQDMVVDYPALYSEAHVHVQDGYWVKGWSSLDPPYEVFWQSCSVLRSSLGYYGCEMIAKKGGKVVSGFGKIDIGTTSSFVVVDQRVDWYVEYIDARDSTGRKVTVYPAHKRSFGKGQDRLARGDTITTYRLWPFACRYIDP